MEVNAIGMKSGTNESKQCVKCKHCAKSHASKCRFWNATCYKCHMKGHTKAACSNLEVNKQQKLRVNTCCHCESSEEECERATEDNFGVHEVSSTGAGHIKPFMVEVTVNGVPLVMEVDSGSARTILPHSVYRQHRSGFLTLCSTRSWLLGLTMN